MPDDPPIDPEERDMPRLSPQQQEFLALYVLSDAATAPQASDESLYGTVAIDPADRQRAQDARARLSEEEQRQRDRQRLEWIQYQLRDYIRHAPRDKRARYETAMSAYGQHNHAALTIKALEPLLADARAYRVRRARDAEGANLEAFFFETRHIDDVPELDELRRRWERMRQQAQDEAAATYRGLHDLERDATAMRTRLADRPDPPDPTLQEIRDMMPMLRQMVEGVRDTEKGAELGARVDALAGALDADNDVAAERSFAELLAEIMAETRRDAAERAAFFDNGLTCTMGAAPNTLGEFLVAAGDAIEDREALIASDGPPEHSPPGLFGTCASPTQRAMPMGGAMPAAVCIFQRNGTWQDKGPSGLTCRCVHGGLVAISLRGG